MTRARLAIALVACATTTIAVAAPTTPTPKPPTRVTITVMHPYPPRPPTRDQLDYANGAYTSAGVTIAPALVDALYAAMTDLRRSDGLVGCVAIRDGSRASRVVVDGDRPLELTSASSCADDAPWNVITDGRLFVQYSGALGIAVHALIAAAEPNARPSHPVSANVGGIVALGTYRDGAATLRSPGEGIAVEPPMVAACAHSLQSDPKLRAAFGQDLVVSSVDLVCDRAASADCRRPIARATFPWDSVDATIGFACVDGKIDPAFAAELAPVIAFVHSAPARALAKLSSQRLRLDQRPHSTTWHLQGLGLNLELTTPTTITVEGLGGLHQATPPGATFWQELGIDPLPLVQTSGVGKGKITATLDLAGKVVTPRIPLRPRP